MTAAHAPVSAESVASRPFRLLLADEVRAHLARRRWSNRRFAAMLGVTAPWIDRRLNGTTPMTTDDIERFAAALGMSALDLVASIPTGPGSAQESITARFPTASPAPSDAMAQVIALPTRPAPVAPGNTSPRGPSARNAAPVTRSGRVRTEHHVSAA